MSQLELKQREETEQSLARSLAMSDALKKKWRTDIEAEVRKAAFLDISCLKVEASQQKSRADNAEAELHELRKRVAELEAQLDPNAQPKGIR